MRGSVDDRRPLSTARSSSTATGSGVVDEPDQPAESWGELTYGRVAELAAAQAAALDGLASARVSGWDRVPQLGPAPGLVLRGQRLGPGPRADQLPAERRRGRATSSSTRARRCCSSTRARRRRSPTSTAKHRFVLGAETDDELWPFDAEPAEPWAEPDEDATATINYTSGTTARPKGVQLTHRNLWVNAATFGWQAGVTDRDVYLHTLPMFHCNGWGMPYAVTGMGGTARRAAQGRRRRDPAAGRRARRHAAVRGAGRRGAVLDAAASVGRADPRGTAAPAWWSPGAAAHPHDRAGRDRARLGVHPDLRPHRDVAAAHDEPPPGRVGRPGPPSGRASSGGPAHRRSACRLDHDQGEVLARCNVVLEGYWEQPDGDRRGHRRRLVPHRRRRHASTTRATSRSPTARRT